MERKEWLETFLRLADSNATTLQYRKLLRLKANALAPHVKNLSVYRQELQDIYEQEKKREEAKQKKKKIIEELQVKVRTVTSERSDVVKDGLEGLSWDAPGMEAPGRPGPDD